MALATAGRSASAFASQKGSMCRADATAPIAGCEVQSLYRRRVDDLVLLAGEDLLSRYQFNTMQARAFLLLALRHLHPSSAAVEPEPIQHQRRLLGQEPVRFRMRPRVRRRGPPQ